MYNEHFYQDIVDHGAMLIWVAGLDKGCFYFNRAWLEFTDRSLEQEEGQGWTEGIHPDDYDRCLQTYTQAFDARQKFSMLYRLRRHDGIYRWLQDDGTPLYSATGEFKGFIGYCLDVTESKQIEIRAQQRSQLLQALSSGTPLSELLSSLSQNLEALYPYLKCKLNLLHDESSLNLAKRTPLREFYQQNQGKGGHCWSEPLLSSKGQPLGVLSVYCHTERPPSDKELNLIKEEAQFTALIVEKKYAEAALQLGAKVFQQAREAIMVTDIKGHIIEVNQAFSKITGYQRDEALGKTPQLLKSDQHPPGFYRAIWKTLQTQGHWQGEIWNLRKNGEIYPVMCNISGVTDELGKTQQYVSLFSDISLLKEHQKQLEFMAHYDSLTQLPNRVLLTDRLTLARAHCLRTQTALAVGFLDLDGFKQINDTHSHEVGDQLLITLTQRLRQALRESDTLARLGGDEFILVLTDLSQPEDYQRVLERLLQAASEPLVIDDKLLQVSASIGVTLFPADQSEVDGLIRHADHAMYQAKEAGKNCYRLFQPLTNP
ncbi:diguanylate cyclase domain-containing protein [Marinospirillum sp.]|uniref:sensor domain-containing protein n=1 Tax=Marinospirillum sp. TaxID=2183934 RepID=UPI0028703FFD|nr:diguanylate cyclase [Marinospirillum sp.]MDR9468737.1 diguanylate cyclase [Marinospirillum sp.]